MLLVVVGGVDFWILELIPKNNRKRIQITYHNQQKQMKEFMIKVVMYGAEEHKRKNCWAINELNRSYSLFSQLYMTLWQWLNDAYSVRV